MNEIKIFNNPQFGEIRTTKTGNGDPLFCASDITKILGYKNGRKAIIDNCGLKGVTTSDTPTNGGIQQLTYINESNLYRLIMRSKMPDAERFQDWVCEEVLPAIRKTGGYIVSKQEDTPEIIMARAVLVAQESINRLKTQLEAQAPKVLFADCVTASNKSILVGELAKILKQNGIDMGQNRLFKFLRENGYLLSKGDFYNRPSQRAMEMGLFEIEEWAGQRPNGETITNITTKVTGKGQLYFVNKFIPTLQKSA